MKLKEMPGVVVHCPDRETYDKLMEIYEKAGWMHVSGRDPRNNDIGWDLSEAKTAVYVKDKFEHDEFDTPHRSNRVLTLPQFLKEQGIEETPHWFKKGEIVRFLCDCTCCGISYMKGDHYAVRHEGEMREGEQRSIKLDNGYLIRGSDLLKNTELVNPQKPEVEYLKSPNQNVCITGSGCVSISPQPAKADDTSISSPKPMFKVGDKLLPADTPIAKMYFSKGGPICRDGGYFIVTGISPSTISYTCYDKNGEFSYSHTTDIDRFKPYTSIPPSPSFMSSFVSFLKDKARSKSDRTLLRAGLINECGDATPEGTEALLVILFEEKKEELVKLAEEKIESEEKSKKSK